MKVSIIDKLLSLIGRTKRTAVVVQIFTSLVLGMDIYVVLRGYEISPFSKLLMFIFGALAIVGTLAASWLLFTDSGKLRINSLSEVYEPKAKANQHINGQLTLERMGLVIFASLALSAASFTVSVTIALWIIGPDFIAEYFDALLFPLIAIFSVAWFPYAKKNVR